MSRKRRLFLVDWGENRKIGRYAVVSARDAFELFWMVDTDGDPTGVRVAKIGDDEDCNIYIPLADPRKTDCTEFAEHVDYTGYEDDKDVPDIFERENAWFSIHDNTLFKGK